MEKNVLKFCKRTKEKRTKRSQKENNDLITSLGDIWMLIIEVFLEDGKLGQIPMFGVQGTSESSTSPATVASSSTVTTAATVLATTTTASSSVMTASAASIATSTTSIISVSTTSVHFLGLFFGLTFLVHGWRFE
jgi:hypothetical protein